MDPSDSNDGPRRDTDVETPAVEDVLGAIDAAAAGSAPDDVHVRPTAEQPRAAADAAADPFASFSEEGVAAAVAARDAAGADEAEARARRVSRAIPVALTTADAVELVGKVNLFSGLPRVYLERIAKLCVQESHPQGQFVFREHDPGDKLYLILDGAVRISRTVPGMGEEALAVLKAGDYFGEMALIDDFPRSADAYVHESCRLLVIGKDALQDLLFVDRDLAYDLLWTFVRTLSGRLRQTNDKMTFMAVTSKF